MTTLEADIWKPLDEVDEDPNRYWYWFLDYVRYELEAGGPDPQIKTVAHELLRIDHDQMAARYAGMFVNAYTVAGAAAQWAHADQVGNLEPAWLDQHFGTPGLPLRKERRSVKGKVRFEHCHYSWNQWVKHDWPEVRYGPAEAVFDSIHRHVDYYGRYATMKVVETLYQANLLAEGQHDVQPRGAKFPRRTLAKLFPDDADWLLRKGEYKGDAERVQQLALAVKLWLRDHHDLDLSWYQLETVLCTFRQACGRNKYPGRSQDRELMYWEASEDYWVEHGVTLLRDLRFYYARAALFDQSWLGEVGGWSGPREELEETWIVRYPEGVAY